MSDPRTARATRSGPLRRLRADEASAVLHLLDDAVTWLVSSGNAGQWGHEPFSSRPGVFERARGWCEHDEGWALDQRGGGLAAALVLGDRNPYVPALDEPELYVRLLVGSRSAPGAGSRLLEHAARRAAEVGVGHLRVDCFAGGSGALVRYYESQGFERREVIDVDGWPCQVLVRRIDVDQGPSNARGP